MDMTDNLQFRRGLALLCVQTLERMTENDLIEFGVTEIERQNALTEYRKQLAEIEASMTTPPPVVVGFKTANLFGKVGG
jgi:hypothetical protein